MSEPQAPRQFRLARAGLMRLVEPPAPAVWALVRQVGPVAAWSQIADGHAAGRDQIETQARHQDRDRGSLDRLAAADLEAAEAVGARLLIPEDDAWPHPAFVSFGSAAARGVSGSTAPLGLYVRGADLSDLPQSGLSIVGSRACTPYGQRLAADIAAAATASGRTVVSGAAFGIDSAAHRGALGPGDAQETDLPTVAVLACGIDRVYPAANKTLIDSIARAGSVVSEYPPGTTPARHRFLVRNRLIAALSAGTLVVEAGRRSGTLSTAAAARHLGRVLMTLPGPVTSALSVGCHQLIRDDQAVLVTDFDQINELLDPISVRVDGRQRQPAEPALSPDCRRVQDALSFRKPMSIAELTASSAVSATQVLIALTELDLAGLATRDSEGWRAVRPKGAPRMS